MVKKIINESPGVQQNDTSSICGIVSCSKPVTELSGGMQCDVCNSWFHEACTGLTPDQYALASSESLLYSCNDCCKLRTQRYVTTKDCFDSLVARLSNMEQLFSSLMFSLDGKVDRLLGRLTLPIASTRVKTVDCGIQTVSVDEKPPSASSSKLAEIDHSVGGLSPVTAVELQTPLPTKSRRRKNKKTESLQPAVEATHTECEVNKLITEPTPVSSAVSLPPISYAAVASPLTTTKSHAPATVTRGVGTPRRGDSYTDSSVIFRNVTESNASLPKERLLCDLNWFRVCVSKLLPPGFPGVTVRKLIRLGPAPVGMSDARPRLLRVVLSTPDERKALLRFAFKLKDSGVSVQPDLPLADRSKLKEALKDLKARREAGETGLHLVGFRVVSRRSNSALPEPVLMAHDPRLQIPVSLKSPSVMCVV